jgi:hypothetical protein
MSGYECASPTRAAYQEMDRHFQNILYTDWFQNDFARFSTSLDNTLRNVTCLKLWTGSAGSYWCRPGSVKKYITLILVCDGTTVAFEQDSLDEPSGHFRTFSQFS